MPELVFKHMDGRDVLMGFKGVIVRREVPGVHVPAAVRSIFHPYESSSRPATRVRVCCADDHDVWYEADIARVSSTQSIACVPVDGGVPDERFPPGMMVVVERVEPHEV